MFLNGNYCHAKDMGVSWLALGAVHAAVLGEIPIDQRKQVYRLLLGQFLQTETVMHWSDKERREALKLL
jgi:hypothetical protein